MAILLSRVFGLVREALLTQFLGLSLYADAWRAAIRLPNLLQNLLGEGTLSASFIPVYAELLGQGRKEEAGRVAGAVLALLVAVAGLLALIGVALAPVGVTLLLPGFVGETREITIALVRILFPMTGVLVLSAWALGVLNSHRRFFLSYSAPVLWSISIMAVLLVGGFGLKLDTRSLVLAAGWGALLGGVLQFLVQLPAVFKLERELKVRWNLQEEGLRETVRNAGPAVVGRGVVQVSGYLDIFLASALATSAVAALGSAQTLYMLPVSLFGMSVAAAELPELARERQAATQALRQRAEAAQRRVTFYVVPSVVAFVLLGDTIVAGLYQRGQFGPDETTVVHYVLAGYAVGLIPSTSTRLLSSTFFALRDTVTPARFATARVVLSGLLGFALMSQLEAVRFDVIGLALPPGIFADFRVGTYTMGALGLALGTGVAAWIEWALLYRALRQKIGAVDAGLGPLFRALVAAGGAAAGALLVRSFLPELPAWLQPTILTAAVVCGVYGLIYVPLAAGLGLEEGLALLQKVLRRLRR